MIAKFLCPAFRHCFWLFAVLASCNFSGQKGNTYPGGGAPILIFNGTGISANDVTALESILDDKKLQYTTIGSADLNLMSLVQLEKYRLLIVPGGDFLAMGKSVTIPTAEKILSAVKHGLNYLGICAGAFLAGKSAYYNAFNLTGGVTFRFYSAEDKGIRKAAIKISDASGTVLEQYWEDGPALSGWGRVVAKYPDMAPAIAAGKCGSGLVILSGIHAEAPGKWRNGMVFNTPATVDNAFAEMLIDAGLGKRDLSYF